jgi:hypothetical protein
MHPHREFERFVAAMTHHVMTFSIAFWTFSSLSFA